MTDHIMPTPRQDNKQAPEVKSGPKVSLKNIHLTYGSQNILDDVSIEVFANEVVALVGPSGTGKSTLIKIIAGLLQPNEGEIILSSQHIGLAFQDGALFTSMTVYENLLFILERTTELSADEMDERITEALAIVGLDDVQDKQPSELSGGMQKRVGIARALAIYPDIMLYDEPSAGLDPILANKLEKDLRKINEERQMATIAVTHELPTIRTMADRVLMLYEGKIVYRGSKDDFFSSQEPYALQFRTRREAGPIDV